MSTRFEIYWGETLVGHSVLEEGDAPMGCAVGRFYPSDGYTVIQAICRGVEGSMGKLQLSARTPAGASIPAAGTAIFDLRADLKSDEAIQVHVDGIPYPLYEELFPQHVAAYKKLGKGAG